MLYVGIGTAAVSLAGGYLSYTGQKVAAQNAADQANASGVFAAYKGYRQQYNDAITANQVMDQAQQQVTILQRKAAETRGSILAAQGASGTVAGVGGAQVSQDVVDKLSASDVAATLGSAINKQTAIIAEGANADTTGQNSLTASTYAAKSDLTAGEYSADASLLSSIGSAANSAGSGYRTSLSPTSPGTGT